MSNVGVGQRKSFITFLVKGIINVSLNERRCEGIQKGGGEGGGADSDGGGGTLFHLFPYCLMYDILTILINVQHAKLLRFQIGYTATCSFTEAAYHSYFIPTYTTMLTQKQPNSHTHKSFQVPYNHLFLSFYLLHETRNSLVAAGNKSCQHKKGCFCTSSRLALQYMCMCIAVSYNITFVVVWNLTIKPKQTF